MTTLSGNKGSPRQCGQEWATRQPAADVDLVYVLRVQAGDSNAFTPLWNKYWRTLCNYFVSQIRNREEAEDLASETLLAAFDQLPVFRGYALADSARNAMALPTGQTKSLTQRCTFETYLRAIARYKLKHWIRRKTNRPCCGFADLQSPAADTENSLSPEEGVVADADADPLVALMHQESLDEVCYALAEIGMRSSEQFKALIFYYFCDLTHKEVAHLLDTRIETINTRLQEGRNKLQRHYERTRHQRAAVSC